MAFVLEREEASCRKDRSTKWPCPERNRPVDTGSRGAVLPLLLPFLGHCWHLQRKWHHDYVHAGEADVCHLTEVSELFGGEWEARGNNSEARWPCLQVNPDEFKLSMLWMRLSGAGNENYLEPGTTNPCHLPCPGICGLRTFFIIQYISLQLTH